MKKVLLGLMLVGKGYAMDIENQVVKPVRPSSAEIATKIAEIIVKYGDEVTTGNDQFKNLVIQYFKKESLTIESSIMPHLKQKLRDSDSDITDILVKDDKVRLEALINRLIAESVEDAFNEKEQRYDELKLLAENRLKNTKYAMATAIVSGISGVLAVFFGVYFGR